jgi:DNA-binding SARP family transcriptional activator/Flp pilus assembly protein TadD
MFALRLFGGLSLERDDAAAVPPGALQRRRLTLLALLAVAGKRGLARERIQVYLWPDNSPDRSRHALDQLLYATRLHLGHDVILSSATDLRLNPDRLTTDLHVFDEAIRDRRWSDAAEQYAGPLLDGLHLVDSVEFEQWLDATRVRCEHDHHRALESLARAAAERGDLAGATRWWRARAASDPLNADVALELIKVLAAAGNPTGARQYARDYQELVRSTLELEPDPAVEALAATLAAPRRPRERDATPARHLAAHVSPDFPDVRDPVDAPAPAQSAATPRRRAWRRVAGIVALATCAIIAALFATHWPVRSFTVADASTPRTSRVPRARVLYLRAQDAWNLRSKSGLEQAVVLYRQATVDDPMFAAAFGGLAESYVMLGYFGFEPGDATFSKGKAAALRALELDSTTAGAYAALGQALAWEHAWAESEHAYRRAIALTPADPTAHQWYALLLAYLGRIHEARLQTAIASRLDPLSVQINNMHGVMLYYDGDLAGALRQFERTVNEEPDSAWVRQNPWVLDNYGHIAAAAGRREQAIALIELALRVVPTHPRPLLDLASVYIDAGDTSRARDVFARADTTHPHFLVYRGILHARLGELDAAFAAFDRVRDWPVATLVGLQNDPSYAALRADPRYALLRQRLRLPPPPRRGP